MTFSRTVPLTQGILLAKFQNMRTMRSSSIGNQRTHFKLCSLFSIQSGYNSAGLYLSHEGWSQPNFSWDINILTWQSKHREASIWTNGLIIIDWIIQHVYMHVFTWRDWLSKRNLDSHCMGFATPGFCSSLAISLHRLFSFHTHNTVCWALLSHFPHEFFLHFFRPLLWRSKNLGITHGGRTGRAMSGKQYGGGGTM